MLEEVPEPHVGPDDVLVDVAASALNFPDVLMIAGKYQTQPPLPFSPGGELACTVSAVGANVTNFAEGDRVFGGTDMGK